MAFILAADRPGCKRFEEANAAIQATLEVTISGTEA